MNENIMETETEKETREEREDTAFWRNIQRLGMYLLMAYGIKCFFEWI